MKVAEDKPIKINKRKIDRNPLLNSTISLTAPEKIQFFFVLRPILFKKERSFLHACTKPVCNRQRRSRFE